MPKFLERFFPSLPEKSKEPCPPEDMLNWIRNAQGQSLKQELDIHSWGNLSNATVVYPTHNQGWASNLLVLLHM